MPSPTLLLICVVLVRKEGTRLELFEGFICTDTYVVHNYNYAQLGISKHFSVILVVPAKKCEHTYLMIITSKKRNYEKIQHCSLSHSNTDSRKAQKSMIKYFFITEQ